ncbi:hypothetical protein [Paractinoplanes hotanensis]|uniref:DUF3040 domain-containing protein n=1 Tax=Paractinoplanes hotanensis TaxID=2906497 RepID=A0ABT0YCT0_9ACTN|nr:hypothetical protein [Actinoplanes hotanensis]MCM4083866.1 hypothetical protein [Actinoplanes hotanensis]
MEAERWDQEFDQIVTRLVAEEPSLGSGARGARRPSVAAKALLAGVAAVAWAALYLLMIAAPWIWVLVTVPAVAAGIVIAVRLSYRESARPGSGR